ncbi:MAG: hypothetical protein MJY98_02220 [Fibrobacter sp.]|nr:hypothetical protein [Fibrobacter sp.]
MPKQNESPLRVQFIHPNNQTKFNKASLEKEKSKWAKVGDDIIRLWNYETHIRRPMVASGNYIDKKGEKKFSDKLYFWGEWEDCSRYDVQENVHSPILVERPDFVKTNTDPYVFGSCFKYTNCKQRGKLVRMDFGSLILFGCMKGNNFLLDTVFVVKEYCSFAEARKNNNSDAFRIAVLNSLRNEKKKVVHTALMYDDNKEIFSFVPCKLNNSKEDGRLKIPFGKCGLKKSPYNKYLDSDSSFGIWKNIKSFALKQGFVLGFNFVEPALEKIEIPSDNKTAAKKKWPNSKCNSKSCCKNVVGCCLKDY